MQKIKKIKIEALRGITELDLDLECKSLIIFGENGAGKSSIVDALEFFFTGGIRSLEGTQVLSMQRHGPHVNKRPEDVKVQLFFDPGNIPLFRTFTDFSTCPDLLKDYFEEAHQGQFLLRRSQILEFIISQPGERYLTIASIIGVESLDPIEREMMRSRDRLEGDKESIEKIIKATLSELTELFTKEVKDQNDILEALNGIIDKLGMDRILSVQEITKCGEILLRKLKLDPNSNDKIKKLDEIISMTTTPLFADGLIKQIKDFSLKVNEVLENDKNILDSLSLEVFLNSGMAIVEKLRIGQCPLCEQPIDDSNLLLRIKVRLDILRSLSDTASGIRKDGQVITRTIEEIIRKISELIVNINSLDEMSIYNDLLVHKRTYLSDILNKIADAKDLKHTLALEDFERKMAEILSDWVSVLELSKGILQSSDLTDEEKDALEKIRLFTKANTLNEKLSELTLDYKVILFQYVLSEKIYNTFCDEKKTKIQQIYDSIKGDITKYYSKLHPGEPHGNINLEIDSRRRASTNLKMDSFGRAGEDPRALASEGHLDSLGLCIFLAFVKSFNKNCTLVVLDDVVTTIDSSHRARICDLLFEEFKDKQLFVTTHDGIWNDQLRRSQVVYGVQGDFLNKQIIDWSLESGPVIANHQTKWESIVEKISSRDMTSGNLTRQLLEEILMRAVENFKVSGRIKFSLRYEARELYDPTKKRLKELYQQADYDSLLKQAIEELDKTEIMANLLSHNNISATNVSISEVERFANAVNKFEKALQCGCCGNDVKYSDEFGIIRCPSPRCNDPFEIKSKKQ